MKKDNSIIVYQSKTGALELREDVASETIWANQSQIVALFEVDQSVVSRHINNIFKGGEISRKSNMQKMHNAFSDKLFSAFKSTICQSVRKRQHHVVLRDLEREIVKS